MASFESYDSYHIYTVSDASLDIIINTEVAIFCKRRNINRKELFSYTLILGN